MTLHPPSTQWFVLGAFLLLLVPRMAAGQDQPVTLVWDPSPDSHAAGYLVYVGTESGAYTEQYDVGNVTAFRYQGQTGVPLFFAVASYSEDHLIGGRSAEVSTARQTATAPAPSAAPSRNARNATTPASVCSSGHGLCVSVETWAETSSDVHSIAVTPDGRAFVIEDGRRVRVATAHGWLDELALSAPPAEVIQQVVVDPSFASTRRVFVSHAQRGTDGRWRLSIVRYREFDNRLGEPAVVVSALALSGESASLTVDADGYIYVAMPAADGRTDVYDGSVLKFAADGTVQPGARASSPILANGFRRPTSIAWDARDRTLWITAEESQVGHLLARVGVTVGEADRWPLDPSTVALRSADLPAGVLLPPRATGSLGYALAAGASLYVHDGEVEVLSFEDFGTVTAFAGFDDGALVLVCRGQDGRGSRVLSVRRQGR